MAIGDAVARVEMTPELVGALAGLRDLQLAEDAHPAIWAAVVAAVMLVLGAAIVWRHRHRWRDLRQLSAFRREFAGSGDACRLARNLVDLLRESGCRSQPPMPPGLAGDDFLAWLDSRAPRRDRGAFVTGIGRVLDSWPYRVATTGDAAHADALVRLVQRWCRANG